MQTIVKRRQLDFIDILLEGAKICAFKFGDISLLALGSGVAAALMTLVVENAFPLRGIATNIAALILWLLLWIVVAAISLMLSMSIAVITENVVDNQAISLPEAVKYAASRLGSALATSVLAGLIILGLSLLLIVPGIVYSTYYAFALYAVALRDRTQLGALKYSKTLVEGQWWRVFGISLGIGVIYVVVNGAITFLLSKISNDPYFSVVPGAISLALGAFFGVANVVLFLNNDFVYQRRLAHRKERERLRRLKKAPSVEEYLEKTRKKNINRAKPEPGKVVRKAQTKTGVKAGTVKRTTGKSSKKTSSK